MSNHTRGLTRLAVTSLLVIGLFAGCSSQHATQGGGSKQAASKPSETKPSRVQSPISDAPYDCGSAKTKKEWDQHNCGQQNQPPKADLTSTWMATSSQGCVIIFKVVPFGEGLTAPVKEYLDKYAGHYKAPITIKAYIDFSHPAAGTDPDYGCGIDNAQFIDANYQAHEPVNNGSSVPDAVQSVMDKHSMDDSGIYNKGVDLQNNLSDKEGGSYRTRGFEYVFFKSLPPFNQVVVQPHGALGESVDAIRTNQSMPTDTKADVNTSTQTTGHFKLSVLKTANFGDYTGAKVQVCLLKPVQGHNAVKVSVAPWMFPAGTQGAGVPAEPGTKFGTPFAKSTILDVGACATGWIEASDGGGTPPTELKYHNGFDESATFSL